MRLAHLFPFLFVAALVCAAQTNAPDTQDQEDVARSPGEDQQVVIPSGRHLAWVEKRGEQRVVLLDGKQQGGIYDEVSFLSFSPNGAHLAFAGKRNSNWVLVYDLKENPQEYTWMSSFAWQPMGSSFAYCACRQNSCRLIVDGVARGAEYEKISYPQYSSDGYHLAYLARRNKYWLSVVDDKETGPWLHAISNTWGFKSGHFYVAGLAGSARANYRAGGRRVWTREALWEYAVDGVPGPAFSVLSPIEFSPDGRHYVYGGVDLEHPKEPRGHVVLDGMEQEPYEGKTPPSSIAVAGIEGLIPAIHGISSPFFNPQGKLVYAAKRKHEGVSVFIDGQAGPAFGGVLGPIAFSPSGQHFAYIALQGKEFVEVRDHQPGATFPAGRTFDVVGWMLLTDGPQQHLAYELVRGRALFMLHRTERALRRIVVDSQAGPEYNVFRLSGFKFSNDLAHYGYEVHGIDGDHAAVVIDGNQSKVYDKVLPGSIAFNLERKTVRFTAYEGQRPMDISLPIGSQPLNNTAESSRD